MVAQVALAEETGAQKASQGLDTTAKGGFGNDITKTSNLSLTIGRVVGAMLAFLGIAFFVLMVIGGYMWMFSMGNEQTSAKAKEIIIAAVVGLLIVLMAYVITMMLAGIFSDTTGVKPL